MNRSKMHAFISQATHLPTRQSGGGDFSSPTLSNHIITHDIIRVFKPQLKDETDAPQEKIRIRPLAGMTHADLRSDYCGRRTDADAAQQDSFLEG